MFGDSNNTPQSDEPQTDGAAMQDSQAANAAAPVTPPSDSAGEYMLEDGTPATGGTTVAPTRPAPPMPHNTDELLDLKRQALQQLSPLLNHLEQTPDEKFRTTMMMIQAADDDTLIRQAYEAALALPDEKARAQALLDVVNEINYFTQAHDAE